MAFWTGVLQGRNSDEYVCQWRAILSWNFVKIYMKVTCTMNKRCNDPIVSKQSNMCVCWHSWKLVLHHSRGTSDPRQLHVLRTFFLYFPMDFEAWGPTFCISVDWKWIRVFWNKYADIKQMQFGISIISLHDAFVTNQLRVDVSFFAWTLHLHSRLIHF